MHVRTYDAGKKMVILNNTFQSPSPMEAAQIAQSALQSNRSLSDAVSEFTAQEAQKNSTNFQNNLAVAAAQITGKGIALDIRG
jgi:hypothetical protein